MEIFKGLQPELVWSYFEEICKIPRPSKKEEKIAAWLMEFAKKHQLEARQDEAGNVLITKPATPGKEQTPGVVLQAHMDMVCEKNAETVQAKNKDQNFELLGIAVNDDREKTLKAMKEDGVTWPQILNTGKVAMEAYGIAGIPEIILFAPDGKILARGLRGDELKAKVVEVME